jgi:hypothetical protein
MKVAYWPGNPIEYMYWHAQAALRVKRGQEQVQCPKCGLHYFPRWRADARQHRNRCEVVARFMGRT